MAVSIPRLAPETGPGDAESSHPLPARRFSDACRAFSSSSPCPSPRQEDTSVANPVSPWASRPLSALPPSVPSHPQCPPTRKAGSEGGGWGRGLAAVPQRDCFPREGRRTAVHTQYRFAVTHPGERMPAPSRGHLLLQQFVPGPDGPVVQNIV